MPDLLSTLGSGLKHPFNFIGKRRYNIKLWKMFCDVFCCMPIVAIIDEKIICMHGGLSPELVSLDEINRLIRPTEIPDQGIEREGWRKLVIYKF